MANDPESVTEPVTPAQGKPAPMPRRSARRRPQAPVRPPVPPVRVKDAHVWGSPPGGTEVFVVYKLRSDGKKIKQSIRDPEAGLVLTDIPIKHLSLDLIRDAFPPGAYQLLWRGERDGKRDILGWSRPFQLDSDGEDEEYESEEEPEAPAPSPVPSVGVAASLGGDLQSALGIMTVLQSMKKDEVSSHLSMFAEMQRSAVEMVRAVTARESQQTGIANLPEVIGNIGAVLKKQSEVIASLQDQIASLRAGGDDDEDDDGGGPVMRPGDSIGDVATAAAVNTVVPAIRKHGGEIVRGLGVLAEGLGEKFRTEAEAKRAAAVVRSNGAVRVVEESPGATTADDAQA